MQQSFSCWKCLQSNTSILQTIVGKEKYFVLSPYLWTTMRISFSISCTNSSAVGSPAKTFALNSKLSPHPHPRLEYLLKMLAQGYELYSGVILIPELARQSLVYPYLLAFAESPCNCCAWPPHVDHGWGMRAFVSPPSPAKVTYLRVTGPKTGACLLSRNRSRLSLLGTFLAMLCDHR